VRRFLLPEFYLFALSEASSRERKKEREREREREDSLNKTQRIVIYRALVIRDVITPGLFPSGEARARKIFSARA